MKQLAVSERLSVPLGAVDRAAARFADLGPGTLGFLALVGSGFGAGATFTVRALRGTPKAAVASSFTELPLVVASVVAALLTATTLAVASALHRRKGGELSAVQFVQLWSRRLAFVGVWPLFFVFARYAQSSLPWLTLGTAAIGGALVSVSAYHFMSEDSRPAAGGWTAWLSGSAVALFAILYTRAIADLSISNHLSFNTGRSDLAYYVNIFRQSSQGIPLGCSLCGGDSHLSGHFDPILVLLSPIYLIYPFAETILILQTVWIASGAIPLYLIARRHIEFRGASLALVAAYLLYPALHGINLFDFHSLALCVPLFLWVVYFFERGSAWGYFISLALALLVREDMPLAALGIGLYGIFSRLPHGPRFGWLTLLGAVGYFVMSKAFIMGSPDPLNTVNGRRGYAYFFEQLVPTGTSTKGLVGTLLTNPAYVIRVVLTESKLIYAAQLLVPLFALPLFARGRSMLLYGAAITLLASRQYLYSIHFQYSSGLVPFLFALTAGALGRIRRAEFPMFVGKGNRLCRALCLGMLMTTSLASWHFGALVQNGTFRGGFRPLFRDPTPRDRARAAFLKKLSDSFPRGTRVAASSRLMTHLGSTTNIFLLDRRQEADYVVTWAATTGLGRQIAQEAMHGDLVEQKRFDDVRVYKTHYPPDVVRKAREARKAKSLRSQAPPEVPSDDVSQEEHEQNE